MKTLHVSSATTWRGGEQQIAYLVEGLLSAGYTQWILCVKGSMMEQYCLKRKIPHFTYKKYSSVNPVIGKRIELITNVHHVDLIHLHDSHAHTYGCMAASLFNLKAPMVLSRRVDFPVSRNPVSKWKYNHPAIQKIICVSEFIKEVMTPDILETSKLMVIHSGVDMDRFPKVAKGLLRKQYKIAKKTIIIANVAAIAPHKDYYTFVETAALVLENNKDVHFIIIGGNGGEEDEIRELIAEKELKKKITLTGFRDDITDLLPEIDLFLLTSKTEGLGTSLLDAQVCAVPIVATRAGGIPEIVQHEKTGLLAPVQSPKKLARQVERLLTDTALKEKVVKNASVAVQSFSKEKMMEKTLEVYKEVMAHSLQKS